MIDRVKVEDHADVSDGGTQKQPDQTGFAFDSEFIFLKQKNEKYDDCGKRVAEKNLLDQRQRSRKIYEKIHERKTQRGAEDIDDPEAFFGRNFHFHYYMHFV